MFGKSKPILLVVIPVVIFTSCTVPKSIEQILDATTHREAVLEEVVTWQPGIDTPGSRTAVMAESHE